MQGLGKPGVHLYVPALFAAGRPKVHPTPNATYRGFFATQQAAEFHGTSVNDIMNSWGRPGWTIPPVSRPWDNEVQTKGPAQVIPKDLLHDAILNPPISFYSTTLWAEPVEDQFNKYTYPAKGCSEIHMIWTDTPCWITCWNDSNSIVKAYRSPKIEFMLAQQPWLENDCLFADIILPVSTKFEQDDISATEDPFETIILEDKCIEPVGESKSDYEIVCLIAERTGLLDRVTEGKTVQEWRRFGFDNSGVSQFISYEELQKDKYYIIPSNPGWELSSRPPIRDFYDNPDEYPLKTPSGKIEFYSDRLAKHFPDDNERPPVPHWVEKSASHDERVSSERARKYPLLCITNHPRWRFHAQLDDSSWMHEIVTGKVRGPDGYLYEPIWINPADAKKRDIEHGDVVKVFNERGGVLVGAYVTERIMPGVVLVDHGARYDAIVPGELDRGGAINTITPHNLTSKNATGMVVGGFLAEVGPVNLDELRKQYLEAFARPYDKGSGLRFERVLAKGDK